MARITSPDSPDTCRRTGRSEDGEDGWPEKLDVADLSWPEFGNAQCSIGRIG